MNKEKRRVPKLRFPGFTEDWEQRKLGDVTNIKTGSRNQQDSVANGKYPFFIRSEKIEKLDAYDFDTEAILVPGDGRIGEIFHYYNGKFALHQRVYKVDDFKGVDAFYLLYLFQCKFKEHALRLNAQGTVPSLRLPMFTEWNIDIPSLQEQICIGRLLNKIELMITLHQRKLEHLKLKKKALLQKLFPKNGERYPELRFPGFTDAWEQRKLEDVCNVYDGTHQTPRYTNSGVMFVSVEDIETLESNKYITEEDFKSEFKVFPEYGDILLTRIGDVGSANVILDEIKRAYYVSLALLKPKDINSLFLLALLSSSSVQSEIWRRTLHIAFPKKINKNEINKVIVNQPSIPEQKKIGKLFFSLDQTITLHQRKLDHLQLQKKALLQQMFV